MAAESDTASLILGVLTISLSSVVLAVLFAVIVAADDEATRESDRPTLRLAAALVALLAAALVPISTSALILLNTWLILDGPGAGRLVGWTSGQARKDRRSAARNAALEASYADLMQTIAGIDSKVEALAVLTSQEAQDSLHNLSSAEVSERQNRLKQALEDVEHIQQAVERQRGEFEHALNSAVERPGQRRSKLLRIRSRSRWALRGACWSMQFSP